MSKNVFMILYNYRVNDYSVIKIMDSLDKAYNYICCQEKDYDEFKMIQITSQKQITENIDNNCLNICYIQNDKYVNWQLSKYENVSSYIIVSMSVC